MGQAVKKVRDRGEHPDSYWQTIRDRIDAGKACTNLNKMVAGIELPPQQERVTLFIINKMLPSLQAVAVQVHQVEPASRHDIDALLLSSGLRPDLLPGWKKSSVLEHSQADPLPPERESE